jgi:hypothetical protein
MANAEYLAILRQGVSGSKNLLLMFLALFAEMKRLL